MDRVSKARLSTIAERNRTAHRILDAFESRARFVVAGHRSPDEDCVASMVATALLLTKISKPVRLLLPEPVTEACAYLVEICRYNAIVIDAACCTALDPYDTLVVCDTAKPEMIAPVEVVDELFDRPDILRIEIDHHLAGDSAYSGAPGYRLVDEGTSTAELVSVLAMKLAARTEILAAHGTPEVFSRNIVLALLTGIVGDTKLGTYFSGPRARRGYRFHTRFLNRRLQRVTTKAGNFDSMDDLFAGIQRVSTEEAACHAEMMSRRTVGRYLGWVLLDRAERERLEERFDWDTVASVSRAVADELAEVSGYVGMVAYVDSESRSGLVQFRLRRSRDFTGLDLRDAIDVLGISDGGGHQGAVAFRFPRADAGDLAVFARPIVEAIEALVAARVAEG